MSGLVLSIDNETKVTENEYFKLIKKPAEESN